MCVALALEHQAPNADEGTRRRSLLPVGCYLRVSAQRRFHACEQTEEASGHQLRAPEFIRASYLYNARLTFYVLGYRIRLRDACSLLLALFAVVSSFGSFYEGTTEEDRMWHKLVSDACTDTQREREPRTENTSLRTISFQLDALAFRFSYAHTIVLIYRILACELGSCHIPANFASTRAASPRTREKKSNSVARFLQATRR